MGTHRRFAAASTVNVLRLEKYHGLGNDFLVVLLADADAQTPDGTAADAEASDGCLDAADLARRLCDRRRGVGADGLILATVNPPTMRLWNSDGSTAEVSGNGLRCLAYALARHQGATQAQFDILTAAGQRRATVDAGTATGSHGTAVVTAEMGQPKLGPSRATSGNPDPTGGSDASGDTESSGNRVSMVLESLGVDALRHQSVNVGNPHIVIEVPEPDLVPLAEAGSAVQSLFPEGINVQFAALTGPSTGRDAAAQAGLDIALRPYERGAGATEACGSGAVATAAAFADWYPGSVAAKVRMPGGDALVQLQPVVTLSGPVAYVAAVLV